MKNLISKKSVLLVSLLTLTLAFTGCGQKESESDSKLTGEIRIDGSSTVFVLVNPDNTWVDYLTVEELTTIWMPDSKVKTWKDIRAEWPDEEIKFYAPGTDSGTIDYFIEAINGESGIL